MQALNLKAITKSAGRHHIALTRLAQGQRTLEHTHDDFCEHFLVLAGRGEHVWNGRRLALSRGWLVHVKKQDSHYYQDPGLGEQLVFINLAMPESWWRSFCEVYYQGPSHFPVGQLGVAGHRLVSEDSTRKAEKGLMALLAQEGPVAGRLLETVSLLTDLLVREQIGGALPDGAGGPLWLTQLVRDMHDPSLVSRPLEFWQARAGRSPEHFSRTCRRYHGCPPSELLNRARISYVKSRLGLGEDKMAALAIDAGYENLGYFYRTFKRLEGCTPGEWLRKHAHDQMVPR